MERLEVRGVAYFAAASLQALFDCGRTAPGIRR
jgi:hypothetical protein